ncbi:MAG: hypothetical protein WEB30_03925 [Cyclobacteriaceae bacterium]
MKFLIFVSVFFLVTQDKRKEGNPLDHLPSNIELLTHFGERADFSPDNKSVAFMAKSFGDAMVIDLDTRVIRCLTCNVPGAVFLRVMHLANGDYLLIGPERFENISLSRSRDNELWYLKKERGSKPTRLNHKMSEGAAVAKNKMTLAFTVTRGQEPTLKQGSSQLVLTDIDTSGDHPVLTNKRVIYESKDNSCVLEAQDFYDNNSKLTVTCYEPGAKASTMSIEIQTGKITNMSNFAGYNEVEGIFPDGKYTCVESDRQVTWLGGEFGMRNIDIWKMKLDGTGKDFERITNFNDFEGGKASNPVVSADGRSMAFQSARASDPAGVGYGILLYKFR